jgi:DNA-binding MarR family transcriptional regulator
MKFEDEIKSKFRSEYQKLRLNLYYTNQILMQDIIQLLKPYSLTPQQYNILRILRGQFPNPVSIKLIKDRMLDKSSDVSRIIDKLLKKDLVSREECKKDRRSKDIVITKKGLDLLKKIDQYEPSIDRRIKNNLSLEEVQLMNKLLDRLRE